MATATKSKKTRGRQPELRDRVVVNLKTLKRATSSELGVTTSYMTTLVQRGFVRQVGKVPHEGRGRPAVAFSLTPKGRGRAQRLSNKSS